jgi:hypothetical protein
MRPHPHPLSTGFGPSPRMSLLGSLEGPLSGPASEASQPPVRCGRCGRQHPAAGWGHLELVDRMSASRVRGLVTVWRSECSIEIRRCDQCGASLARKRLADAGV